MPIKTFEKLIIAFNKDCSAFDETKPIHYQTSQFKLSNNDNNSMIIDELKKELMRRDIEISRLKRILCERTWSNEGMRYLQNEDYKTIMELSGKHSISKLCEEMGINRSGFYKRMDESVKIKYHD